MIPQEIKKYHGCVMLVHTLRKKHLLSKSKNRKKILVETFVNRITVIKLTTVSCLVTFIKFREAVSKT